MSSKSRPGRRAISIAVIAAVTGAFAWAASQLTSPESGGDTAPASSAPATTTPFLSAYPSAYPATVGGNRVLHGDADAAAEFETVRPAGAMTSLPAIGDPVRGTFSPVIDWPLVGIHAVLTPDGRVLTYGTSTTGLLTGYFAYDIWDPMLGLGSQAHTLLPNSTAVDIFCNAQLLLPNGNIEMWGGDITDLSTRTSKLLPNDDSNLFNPLDNSLVRTGKMHRKRWYATATTLPNGEVYIQGGIGGEDYPEVRTTTGKFRLMTGASTGYLSGNYPRNFLGPDGKVFGLTYSQMYSVDPSGPGALTRVGKFTNSNIGERSTSVMFRPGRILQVGGGLDRNLASAEAHVVDINSATPVVTAIAKPAFRRHWANATVLPDGRVFLSGGSPVANDASKGVAYTSEIYDPVANRWSTGATAQRMRLYHSASLLMPDATVLTLAGGANGPQLNFNAEVYYPPYLFKSDGTPAARPIIATLPMTTDPAKSIRIGTPLPTNIGRVTLVKTGSNTHSIDMDQRFLELPFTVVGGELEASLPANAFETPPGFYMMFVIDLQGVPSEAAMLRINVPSSSPAPVEPPPPPPPQPATLTVSTVVINDDGGIKRAQDFAFSVNGSAPVAFAVGGSNVLSVPAGSYTITAPAVEGYLASLSNCSGIVLAAAGSATCTITNNDRPAPSGNLVVNGDFEINALALGTAALVTNLLGWSNTAGPVKVWRSRSGVAAGLNQSNLEIDAVIGVLNHVYQDIVTVPGAAYDLSFLQSPRPSFGYKSNRFEVWWNGTLLGTFARDGLITTTTDWQRATYVVTGTGADRLWFKEYDADVGGALVDDVRLTRK